MKSNDQFSVQEDILSLSREYGIDIDDGFLKQVLISLKKENGKDIVHLFLPLFSEQSLLFIEKLKQKVLIPTGIVSGQPYKIRRKNSYLYLKFTLFSEKVLRPVTGILKALFNPMAVKAMGLLILIIHFYAIVNLRNATSFFNFAEHPCTLRMTTCIISISVILHELGIPNLRQKSYMQLILSINLHKSLLNRQIAFNYTSKAEMPECLLFNSRETNKFKKII
jgi:hypothetical protein